MKYIAAQYGKPRLLDMDAPVVRDHYLLVKSIYSAISPGTELTMSANADEEAVGLGYSSAGQVLEVGGGVEGIQVGDFVAMYGAPYVGHREILAVPKTLCAKIPNGVSLQDASLAGIGAIAIHALRKADIRFGESVVVVGLGIFGQLIAQIAHNAGCIVLPMNRSLARAELLRQVTGIPAYTNEQDLKHAILTQTNGKGADVVLLCTGKDSGYLTTKSLEWLRDKGKSVIVGDIQPIYDRELMFSKEIDILISRAGGPGRYDKQYELYANDYPYGQVRWTEGRNTAEYIRLLQEKRIMVDAYYGTPMPLADYEKAYEELANSGATVLTHLLAY